jgi:small subunit ribosomal protein S5
MGLGKAKETVPAREKAVRQAKMNMIKVRRGCGSWECGCGTPHSIPFKVLGRCGSVGIELVPAPRGTNICAEKECAKIFALAGIKDLYANTTGSTRTKLNLIKACMDALVKLSQVKIQPEQIKSRGIKEGNK